ncbi:MAG: bifunctional riboflavin kinase/FAD synthetase [Clostridia bacterium]|nr:bifunctional riboflavin kinase/FAD synthetase [Clostridia bacterium]
MKIYENDFFQENKKGCVLALGNFDGVHKGHAYLLDCAKEYADKKGLDFGVYTFVKHPKVLGGKKHEMLCTLQERLSLLKEHNPDFVYLESFDEVKDLSPESFVDLIVEKFCAECAFCGDNFTFGKMAVGTSGTLELLMKKKGKQAVVVKPVEVDGTVVSSTQIRNCLHEGNAQMAARLLGRGYCFVSTVLHGQELGRKLGFPTINQIVPEEKILPALGVYSSVVAVDGKDYMGVTNIGVKPTVWEDERKIMAETHIIDFSGDVYGKTVSVELYKRLRGEKKFKSLSELTQNISQNVQQTREYFKEFKYEE